MEVVVLVLVVDVMLVNFYGDDGRSFGYDGLSVLNFEKLNVGFCLL